MKIKLQNYSLISNEWIDEHIKDPLQSHLIKQQLIPSEKLALQSWKAGFDDDKHLESTKALVSSINSFLTSEIELPIT